MLLHSNSFMMSDSASTMQIIKINIKTEHKNKSDSKLWKQMLQFSLIKFQL